MVDKKQKISVGFLDTKKIEGEVDEMCDVLYDICEVLCSNSKKNGAKKEEKLSDEEIGKEIAELSKEFGIDYEKNKDEFMAKIEEENEKAKKEIDALKKEHEDTIRGAIRTVAYNFVNKIIQEAYDAGYLEGSDQAYGRMIDVFEHFEEDEGYKEEAHTYAEIFGTIVKDMRTKNSESGMKGRSLFIKLDKLNLDDGKKK